jgi:RNA polymerase sigma-70 factor (ECF subfamily)
MNEVNSKVITKLKQRQKKAFEIVYNKYHKLLFFIAFKITKDEQASLDIMQDAFVNFMNKIEEYEDDGKLKQYLSSIARNLSLNYVQNKANNTILLDDNIINEKHYEDNTKVAVLLALEKCLSPLEIEVVSLKVLFDYNFREIAEDLNLSIGTIQATYYRAIELLKHYYTKGEKYER